LRIKNDRHRRSRSVRLCVLHFTLALETSCSEMRRETALGTRRTNASVNHEIHHRDGKFSRACDSGLHLDDDLKARILSTF